MMRSATPEERQAPVEPPDEAVDHVRRSSSGRLVLEFGDYECPCSRQAFRQIELVEKELGDEVWIRSSLG